MKLSIAGAICITFLSGCRELGYAMQGMGEGMIMSQQMYLQQQVQQQMIQDANSSGVIQGDNPSGQMQGIKCPRCGDTYYGRSTCPRCSAPKY